MTTMKSQVLRTIYRIFDDWSRDLPAACSPSCCNCCTDRVTLTAQEGEAILRFLVVHGMSRWFAETFAGVRSRQPAIMTTNDFALACLEGRESDPGEGRAEGTCPFLGDDRLCRIYEVRPFACRLFASTRTCSKARPALMPEYYFEAATAVSQLVEHLGQREYWGYMQEVLPALLDISEFKEIGLLLPPGQAAHARLGTLTARPLPGFLLSEENEERVATLLERIFRTEIDGRTVEDILNGR